MRANLAALYLLVLTISCSPRQKSSFASSAFGSEGPSNLVHHPIQTQSLDAQKNFDAGLAYLYAFNFSEAVASFQRARDLDSNAAMPLWGIALAEGPNYNMWTPRQGQIGLAAQSLMQAETRAYKSHSEQRYIAALKANYSEYHPDNRLKAQRTYANRMRQLAQDFPDDPDAVTLYAAALMNIHPWRLWDNHGLPNEDTNEIVSVLGSALRRWPKHIGANHYYIHALEGAPYPERALPSALFLRSIPPVSGHLVHMPSHIFYRTGRYAEAVESSWSAYLADKQYVEHAALKNSEYMGYTYHNVLFLIASAEMDGDFKTAQDAARVLASSAHMSLYTVMPLMVSMRFGRWHEVLDLTQPSDASLAYLYYWHFARGCSFSQLRNPAKASEEKSKMEDISRQIKPGKAFGMFTNDWSSLFELASNALAARIAFARGNVAEASEKWRCAVRNQEALVFDDLPDWFYPVRESLGALLLENKDAAAAERVFREDLIRTPRNPRSLYGLAKALEMQAKSEDAKWVKQEFSDSWKGLTPPVLSDF